MAKVIVEDCLRISISRVNSDIGFIAKQQAEEFQDIPRQEKWGLARFFSLEKPEWLDPDEWLDETKVDAHYLLGGNNRNQRLSLKIVATPLKKNQLTFIHPVTKRLELAPNQYGEAYEIVDDSYIVRLTTISHKGGGVQYYFTCPLATKGVKCGRRVSELYIPPRANYFACRHCYNLTYASRNVSRTGGPAGTGELLRLYLKANSGQF